MQRTLLRPQAVLIGVTLLWGSTFAVTKDLLHDSPPLLYLAFRFSMGALLLGLWQLRRAPSRVLAGDALVLGLLQTGGLLLQVLGQAYTTASKSAFITALSVPLVPVCGLLLHGERPGRQQALAVVVGALGVLLLTYPRTGVSWNRGDLLTGGCALVYSVAIVETARRARRQPALRLAAAQTVVCAACFSLIALFLHLGPRGLLGELSLQEGRPLLWSYGLLLKWLYMGVVCTVVTFSAQTWAMARMNATEAAVIFALEPVFATALALLLLGFAEWPGMRGAIGAALVLCAVVGAEVQVRGRPALPDSLCTGRTARENSSRCGPSGSP